MEIFEDCSPHSPQQPPQGITAAANAGAGSPKSRCGAGEGLDSYSPSTATNPTGAGGATDVVADRFRPTHVVYLDASLEHIVEQQGLGEAGGGGKEAEAKLRARLERYFAQEQQAETLEATDSTSTENVHSGEKQRPSKSNGPGSKEKTAPGEEVGVHRNGDHSRDEGRWIPATATALQDRYAIKVHAINSEDGGGGEGDASDVVVTAVDEHICGGEVPAFVWMLSGGDGVDTAVVEEAGKSSAEEKKVPQEDSDGVGGGEGGAFGEGCQAAGDEMSFTVVIAWLGIYSVGK